MTVRALGLGRRAFNLGALGLGAGGCRAALASPEPTPRVLMISIDGLRPEYIRDADGLGLAIPTLRRLAAAGAVAEGVEGVWPTSTYPAHATLVTGVHPARHGILTNRPFDPAGKNLGGWYWYASVLRVKTLWDVVRARGLVTGAVYWPVTVGAAIDWNVPQIWRTKTDADDRLLRALSTPGLAREIERANGALPAEHRFDDERARAAAYVLRTRKPHLMLAYLTDLDAVQHEHGPFKNEVFAMLERIDGHVATILRSAGDAGVLPETTVAIVSDHGFSPVHTSVRPGVLLARAGLLDVDTTGHTHAFRAAPYCSGGTAGIVLSDPLDASLVARTRAVLDRAAVDPTMGIWAIHTEEEMRAAGGFPGSTFVLEASAGFHFSPELTGPPVVADHGGQHGYPPEIPAMRATLILSGRGVRKGKNLGLVRQIDVAPTLGRILGVELPDAEGDVIASALA